MRSFGTAPEASSPLGSPDSGPMAASKSMVWISLKRLGLVSRDFPKALPQEVYTTLMVRKTNFEYVESMESKGFCTVGVTPITLW